MLFPDNVYLNSHKLEHIIREYRIHLQLFIMVQNHFSGKSRQSLMPTSSIMCKG